MKIVADYKKRKELKEYLPHHEHWKLKSDRKSGSAAPTSNTVLAQLSPNSAAEGETKVSDNSSDGRKRSAEDGDEEEQENSPVPRSVNMKTARMKLETTAKLNLQKMEMETEGESVEEQHRDASPLYEQC